MNNFKELIIEGNASLKEAMFALNKTARKILFVVDSDNKYVGSLSDGDIRRWILRSGDLQVAVHEVAAHNSFAPTYPYDSKVVGKIMQERDIDFVPVLNIDRQIINILNYEEVFQGSKKVKPSIPLGIPVVIMAGGKGTRLEPFTKILPKPLIPIGDKTILEMIIDKFLPFDVNHFYISVNFKASIIKAYLEDVNPDYAISYLEEDKPLGTIGPLFQLKGKVSSPVLITNCDILVDADFSDFLEHHRKTKNAITMVVSLRHYKIPYGVCEIENGGDVRKIHEKPEYNYLINTGMYIVNPEAIEMIPENEFFNMTDLMENVSKAGGRVGVYPINENAWSDTGEWDEFKRARKIFES